jgi:hypothetical protein
MKMNDELRDALDCITGILLNLPEDLSAAIKNTGARVCPCFPEKQEEKDILLRTKLQWHLDSFCDFTRLEVDLNYYIEIYRGALSNEYTFIPNAEFLCVLEKVHTFLTKLRKTTQSEFEGTLVLDDDFKITR